RLGAGPAQAGGIPPDPPFAALRPHSLMTMKTPACRAFLMHLFSLPVRHRTSQSTRSLWIHLWVQDGADDGTADGAQGGEGEMAWQEPKTRPAPRRRWLVLAGDRRREVMAPSLLAQWPLA